MLHDSSTKVDDSFPVKIARKIRTILSILFSCCFSFFILEHPEIQSAKASGKPFRDNRYVDVYREKQIRVVVKCIVPVKEHPKVRKWKTSIKKLDWLCWLQFNFVGKLLGPRGNSMRRLQEETLCKMAILGRGSMKDRKRVNFVNFQVEFLTEFDEF